MGFDAIPGLIWNMWSSLDSYVTTKKQNVNALYQDDVLVNSLMTVLHGQSISQSVLVSQQLHVESGSISNVLGLPCIYYMASVWSRYSACSDRLILRALFSGNAQRLMITGLQKQCRKPYNKELINLESLVFTRKSQTSALLYRGQRSMVSVWYFPV